MIPAVEISPVNVKPSAPAELLDTPGPGRSGLTCPAAGEQKKPQASPEPKQGGESHDSEPKMGTAKKQENVKPTLSCCSTLPVIVLQHPYAKDKQNF